MTIDTKQYTGSILEAFIPKNPVTTTTQTNNTQQTQVNAEGMNAIIQQMMEGDSGLASLMTRQSGGGLYNSSTAQLLANDLATRVSGTAAVASAPKVNNTTQTQTAPGNQMDPKWLLGLQLVGELFGGGSSGGKSGGKAGSIDITGMLGDAGSWLGGLFGMGDEDDEDEFNSTENYGGWGFSSDNFDSFDLGGYSPDYSLSSSSGGNLGTDYSWLSSPAPSYDTGYSSSSDASNWSAGIDYSGDYIGGTVGWTY